MTPRSGCLDRSISCELLRITPENTMLQWSQLAQFVYTKNFCFLIFNLRQRWKKSNSWDWGGVTNLMYVKVYRNINIHWSHLASHLSLAVTILRHLPTTKVEPFLF